MIKTLIHYLKFKCIIIYLGQMVYSVRLRSGIVLARESFVEADIVSSVPESGTAAAHGFSMKVSIYCFILLNYWFIWLTSIFSPIFRLLKCYIRIGMLAGLLFNQMHD